MAITKPEPHVHNWNLQDPRLPTYEACECGEIRRQCNPDDPAFEGDEPYKVSPADFYEVEKEKRQDAIARAVIKIDWKQILEKK